jgi:uncharacterized membrane protein YhaH (DUF805 family)
MLRRIVDMTRRYWWWLIIIFIVVVQHVINLYLGLLFFFINNVDFYFCFWVEFI